MKTLTKRDVRDLVGEAVRARIAAGSEVDVTVNDLPAIGEILSFGEDVGDVAFDLYAQGRGPYRMTVSLPRGGIRNG
jgi:hypothetical protein